MNNIKKDLEKQNQMAEDFTGILIELLEDTKYMRKKVKLFTPYGNLIILMVMNLLATPPKNPKPC